MFVNFLNNTVQGLYGVVNGLDLGGLLNNVQANLFGFLGGISL